VIYLDSSAALAQLFAEDRFPAADLWEEPLTSSRLLQYEVWTRANARRLPPAQADQVRTLLEAVAFVELTPLVLSRALEPFPVPVRTLDAIHLATMEFLRAQGQRVELATYDARLLAAARALRLPVRSL
jgi:predicted nucleic acid-binding protein